MFKKLFIWLLFLLLVNVSYAQSVKGRIVDPSGAPVPFSTVYVKEVSLGAAANEEGLFELHLGEGEYTCVFQCMGYQTITKTLKATGTDQVTEIVLPQKIYTLNEVVVGGGEDPAYRIMRKVIKNAPLYAAMVKSYKAEVYIRGSLNIRKISAMVKLMARDDLKESNIKEGDTYLEESVNEIDFTAPNLTRQKVKSIRSTFPGGNENQSSGAIGFISGNIYQPGAFGSARSPILSGAFSYYKYRYEGVNTYDDVIVYKIKVIPRGEGPQYVKGTLYIIEGLWCLYSLNISISQQLGFDMQLNQTYSEVRNGAWLPVNNRYKLEMDLMGNEGSFVYNTSIRYKELQVNPPEQALKKSVSANTGKTEAKKNKSEKKKLKIDRKTAELSQLENPTNRQANKISELHRKKNEVILKDSLRNDHTFVETYKTVFDSNARKSDSAFWNKVRPIPLSNNEVLSVRGFDSIQQHKPVKSADTTGKKDPRNKRFLPNFVFGGNFQPDTLNSFNFAGLLYPWGIGFNTVDGLTYRTSFSYRRGNVHRGQNEFTAEFNPAYGFSRERMMWDLRMGFREKGRYRNDFFIGFGSTDKDFNSGGGASQLENSVSTLFFRQNLKKYYNRDYAELSHNISFLPFLKLSSSLLLAEVKSLENTSDYSFFYRDEREFSSNVPDAENYLMSDHRDFVLSLNFSWKPMPFYVIKNGRKVPRPGLNNGPEFRINYKKALPLDPYYSDYDFVSAGISQQLTAGQNASIHYAFETGSFIRKQQLFFDDYRHFNVQPLVVGLKSPEMVFNLNSYYRNSTDEYFAEAHLIYSSSLLLLKRLPLIRNRLWTEKVMLNYLYTPDMGNYTEAGYAIGNYFYNLGVFAGFDGLNFRSAGIRLSIPVFSNKEVVVSL
jgi:hypothetical protein